MQVRPSWWLIAAISAGDILIGIIESMASKQEKSPVCFLCSQYYFSGSFFLHRVVTVVTQLCIGLWQDSDLVPAIGPFL